MCLYGTTDKIWQNKFFFLPPIISTMCFISRFISTMCYHHDGIWNSVFLDQFPEQTYIRDGKSKGGLVGESLSKIRYQELILSHHLCNILCLLMDSVYCMRSQQIMTKHAEEEEAGGRKRLDASDRNKIKEELQKHTNRIFAEPEDRLSNIMEQLHPRK